MPCDLLSQPSQPNPSNQIAHRPRRLLQHRQHASHGVFGAVIAHGHGQVKAVGQVAVAVQQGHGDAAVIQLLACSSTSTHATGDTSAIVKDLRKLAMLAIPQDIKIAFEGLSWGRTINEFPQAWNVISQADMPNLGLGLDSFHMFATKTLLDELEMVDPDKIFLVQLADFMWTEIKTVEERISTARTFRVFPGEGVHSDGDPGRATLRAVAGGGRAASLGAAAGSDAAAPLMHNPLHG